MPTIPHTLQKPYSMKVDKSSSQDPNALRAGKDSKLMPRRLSFSCTFVDACVA
jgi:hypothetical protein